MIFLIMFQLYLIIESKHRVIQSARYGAWETAYRPDQSPVIRNEIRNLIMKDSMNTQVIVTKKPSAERSSPRSPQSGLLANMLNLWGYNYYFDPLFSLALFARFGGFNLGLARALEIDPYSKIQSKVIYRHELEYIDIINELASVFGADEMYLPDVQLKAASVLICDDWSAGGRGQFGKRVGVPTSRGNIFDLNFSLTGLWLYPQGALIGNLFTGLNIVYSVMMQLKPIIESIGRAVGIEVEFQDPIDPRGRYFRTDNAPDIPRQGGR